MNSLPFSKSCDDAADGVHRLVEAQAARTPDACAVVDGRVELTYRELDRRANALARLLREASVGPDVPVGVCLERSVAAVVAVLAVLKAGGAYVPLAPEYPTERLAFMLTDARVPVLVADPAAWTQSVPDGVTLLAAPSPDTDADPLPGASDDPRRLAYVIYTSGSTGRPKGVAMEHGPLLNLLRWQARALPLAAGMRVLQFAPLSFDVSFQEIFSTLAVGGTLVLVSEELRRDPRGLLRLLAQENVGRVFLPPVMLHQLAEQIVHGDFVPTALREVVTAGEALRITPAVTRFFSGLPGCVLHNHYGPTETHVATAYTLTGPPEAWPALPPVGLPIDGVEARLFDDADQPVPDGEPGALFLGGACLARGYLHRPDLTDARFVERGGMRFYATGDLARREPNGTLHFLGRADDQVKIRGFRVELGEIEAVLSQHPAVREMAVGVRVDPVGGDGQELVGYVVPRQGVAVPAAAELRRWLFERLPHYLVPTHFATLAALPLTPSGKGARRGGPRYAARGGAGRAAEPPPPATALEKIIARLWEEILAIKNPGVRDNFFEVGGDSIRAVRVHTRLAQALQREFPVTALFEHPTIAALARYLSPGEPPPAAANPIQERARRQQAAANAARARLAVAR